jgi:hypothetical protein
MKNNTYIYIMFSSKGNFILPLVTDKIRNTDTNKIYLFTNARDEPNIAEWIAHHLLLGFDKIFVFDHLSIVPISNKLTNKFGSNVIINRVDGVGNIKIPLMKEAAKISEKENASWMLYLDADEFLCLNNYNNVKTFLSKYTFADALGINWLMFGSSGHIQQPKGLITENFTKSDAILNQHVKSFVRPKEILNIYNPHNYKIRLPSRYYAATNNTMLMNPFNKTNKTFTKVSAYIAHYLIQSEEEYYRRKGRPMDDGSGNKTGLYTNIHKSHNIVPNNQLQYKYSQKIKEYLHKHNIIL